MIIGGHRHAVDSARPVHLDRERQHLGDRQDEHVEPCQEGAHAQELRGARLVGADYPAGGQDQAALDVPDHRVVELVAVVAVVAQGGRGRRRGQGADRVERLGAAGQVGVGLIVAAE